MRVKTFLLVSALALAGLQSCTTDKFDFSKDMDLQVHFADDGFSLGGTNSADIPLSQIIELKENGQLTLDADSNYLFKKSCDSVHVDSIVIGQGSICNGTDQTTEVELKKTVVGEKVPSGVKGFYNFRFEKSIAIDYEPDTQGKSIRELHYVNVSSKDQYGKTSYMNVAINSLFKDISCVTAAKVTYQIPSFYDVVDESELTETFGDGELEGEHEHVIRIKGVNFLKTDLREGEAIGYNAATGKITMKGDLKIIVEATLNLADYEAANPYLFAHLMVGSLGVDKVTGKFDSWQNVTIDPIFFNDLPEFIRDDEVVIDVENPVVGLTLKNEVPAKVQMDANLISVKNGTYVSKLDIGETYGTDVIEFDGADPDVEGDAATSTVLVSRIPTTLPAGVKSNIVVSNMMNLIRKVPDYVEVTANAHTNPDEIVTLSLAKPYHAYPSYDLSAPLKMGADMKIVYKKEIEDLHKDLKDTNVGELVFNADVTNNIPLELSLKVYPLDEYGDTLTSIKIITPDPIPGNSSKNITLRLVNTSDNQLANVDRFVVKAYALSSEKMKGNTLNARQNLRITNAKITLNDSSISL